MKTHRRTPAAHRTLIAAAAAAAAFGLLAGCSAASGDPATTRTVTAAAPSAPATASASPSAAPPTTTASASRSAASASPDAGTTKVDPSAPDGQCEDSALQVSVQDDPEGDGAGQRGAFVVLRNTGSSPCHLEGTPGLSLVGGGDGTQIGRPAERITSGAELVTVEPGGTALAQVQYTYVDEHGGPFSDGHGHDIACGAKAADGYRVYPPHSFRASFTPVETYACSAGVHWITVGPVRPASAFAFFTPKA